MKTVAELVPTGVRELVDATLPVRPHFLPGLVVARTDQGLVIDGASQLHVLWGETAKNVLPAMIDLMDGTRTVTEIAAFFPNLTLQQIQEPISSLCKWGLVEEGTGDASFLNGNPETTSFLRRYSGGFTVGSSGEDAFTRLSSREIILVASRQAEPAAQYLSELLTNTGMGKVSYFDATSLDFPDSNRSPSRNPFLVSLVCDGEDREQQCRWDDCCSAQALPWLRIAIDESANFVDIGPVFDRSKSPCYRCFTATHRKSLAAHGQTHPDFESVKFWICMAAAEITYLLSGVGAPRPEGWFRRYNVKDWTSRSLCFPMIPGCAHCRPLLGIAGQPPGARIDTAVVFEDYVVNRSAPSLQTGAAMSDPQALLELTRQTKRLSNCRQRSLPTVLPELGTPIFDQSVNAAAATSALDLNQLAALLKMTAGVRRIARNNSGMLKRWAATAGNLGSVELCIAARSVEGLAPGFYFYQPQEHSLASFRSHSESLAVDDFMRRAVANCLQELPDALFLFTGAYHRVASKYGAFAYRLINLDAGVAISQLKMVAASLGLSAHLSPRWADDLIEDQLHLDPMAEQSTAVVSLCGKRSHPPAVECASAERSAQIHSSAKAPHEFCDLSVPDVARMVYLESRLREKDLRAAPSVVPEILRTPDRLPSGTIPLPAPYDGKSTLGDILKARTSVRRFRNDSLSLEHLSTMLSFAKGADVHEWPQENQGCLHLNFMVLAERVENLKSGLYEYDSAEQRLNSIGNPLRREQLSMLYVQEEFSSAPLAIWITGNLAASCASDGAFGHRQLLLRAGAAGNRLWMAAMAMGLSGTIIAGMSGSARGILGLDGYLRIGLLAVALGYAAPSLSGVDVNLVDLNQQAYRQSR